MLSDPVNRAGKAWADRTVYADHKNERTRKTGSSRFVHRASAKRIALQLPHPFVSRCGLRMSGVHEQTHRHRCRSPARFRFPIPAPAIRLPPPFDSRWISKPPQASPRRPQVWWLCFPVPDVSSGTCR